MVPFFWGKTCASFCFVVDLVSATYTRHPNVIWIELRMMSQYTGKEPPSFLDSGGLELKKACTSSSKSCGVFPRKILPLRALDIVFFLEIATLGQLLAQTQYEALRPGFQSLGGERDTFANFEPSR